MLIPARTDTKYFHEDIIKANLILFLKGRLKFDNNKNSAPFSSMLVFFGNILTLQQEQLRKLNLGWMINNEKE